MCVCVHMRAVLCCIIADDISVCVYTSVSDVMLLYLYTSVSDVMLLYLYTSVSVVEQLP